MTDVQPPPTRQLTRSVDDRMIAGVCGGLAAATGVDPVVFRVVAVVAALASGGAAVVAYLLAWVLLPEAPSAGLPPPRRRAPLVVVLCLLAFPLVLGLLFASPWHGLGDGEWLGLLVLGAFVAWLLGRSSQTTGASAPAAVAAASPSLAPPAPPALAPPSPPPPPPGPRPRRARQDHRIFLLTAGAALVVGGVLGAIGLSDDVSIEAHQILASMLLVVALGLVAGAWYGRSRGLLFLGVPLAALAIVTSSGFAGLDGGIGQRTWRPDSVAELESRYALGVGDALLDLRRLPALTGEHRVEVRLGLGQLRVLLPDGPDLVVNASSGLGEIELPDGLEAQGRDNELRELYDGEGNGDLVLDLHVGIGHLEVER